MNRLEHHVRTRAATVFVLAAAAVAATAGVHAADGIIHFTGEIVGAPYEISSKAAPAPAPVVVAAARSKTGSPAGQVIFQRQYIDRPSASVRVDALAGQPLQLSFIDARGREHAFDAKDSRAIGQDGGTLSIRHPSSKAKATTRATAALVTVSYN